MKRSVFILKGVNGGSIGNLFKLAGDYDVVDDIEQSDLVVFTGGEDVDPAMYNQNKHRSTHCNINRDKEEKEVFLKCAERGIPMVGICRGAQFLNVMNGGSLFQDVDNHAIGGGKEHEAWVIPSQTTVMVTSTHHQMMIPNMATGQIIMVANRATAGENMSSIGYNNLIIRSNLNQTGPDVKKGTDTEAVFYSDNECLCFQPHPEFEPGSETANTFFWMIDNYIWSKSTEKEDE